jgi:multidrug efflux pump subunit AcrA (membrane-fusion protein)
VATRLHGTVASVGLLSSTSGSLTTFPVFVKLDPGSRHLFDGAGADVVIDTGTAAGVLSVPNSAIHVGAAGRYTVSVVNGGTTTTTRVTLGLIGTDVSQVKSGLKLGDRVLLADPSKSLPSSSTSNTSGSFRFGGRGGGAVVVPNFDRSSVGGK